MDYIINDRVMLLGRSKGPRVVASIDGSEVREFPFRKRSREADGGRVVLFLWVKLWVAPHHSERTTWYRVQ